MAWLKRNYITLILVIILLIGLGLLLYPTVSDYWNSLHQSRVIVGYQKSVADMEKDQYEQVLRDAAAYNEALSKIGVQWHMTDAQLEEYNRQLSVAQNGSMGYISIPSIDVELPIFHGTDLSILDRNIGHIEGSSLPVGGEGSHCVLSGHRGLPSARLFTDLDKLVVGDTFLLHVLDQVLTYEVDQIRIVEPDELSDLAIVPGKDLCTLVTCTPYGINTHRLLVRGHRIDNDPDARRVTADATQIEPTLVAPIIGTVIVLVLVAGVMLKPRKKK